MEWLTGRAGHASHDPFVALGFCAAATRSIQLMTFLAVLPYRHPYVTAKAATTVDRRSAGRLVLAVGSGHLREEFEALGLEFDRRVSDTDEALRILHHVWSESGANGPALRPRPASEGGPAIWVGGNSARARRAAVRWGSGWSPLLRPRSMADSLTTAGLGSLDDLRRGIDDLHQAFEEAGRDQDG